MDPPDLGTQRCRDHRYRHEMRDAPDHAALLDALTSCSAAVAVSGYDSEQYRHALAGWERLEIDAFAGQGTHAGLCTEVVGINRPLPADLVSADASRASMHSTPRTLPHSAVAVEHRWLPVGHLDAGVVVGLVRLDWVRQGAPARLGELVSLLREADAATR